MTIDDLGWNDFFDKKKAELELNEFAVARVIGEGRGSFRVKNADGEFQAKVTGKQMFHASSREDYPAVGDWVAVTALDDEQMVINAVYPRKTVIKRVFGDKNRIGEKNDIQIIAANVDVAFIVQSVGRDLNINRFERYIAMVTDVDITPIVIINKIDLVSSEELDVVIEEMQNRLHGVDMIYTSTVDGRGLDELKNHITKGKTYCLLGSSGVGKSSLVNVLRGTQDVKTGEISTYSDRGTHVTTRREVYFLESGGIIIDNPGIREVGMVDVDQGLNNVFDEIAEMASACKFTDCTHMHEPGCAVRDALESKVLDKEKYENYVSLKKEVEYRDMSVQQKKARDRSFGKYRRSVTKTFKKSGYKYY